MMMEEEGRKAVGGLQGIGGRERPAGWVKGGGGMKGVVKGVV